MSWTGGRCLQVFRGEVNARTPLVGRQNNFFPALLSSGIHDSDLTPAGASVVQPFMSCVDRWLTLPPAHNKRRFSRQGVSCTKAFCQASVCSRKSCLAGSMHYKEKKPRSSSSIRWTSLKIPNWTTTAFSSQFFNNYRVFSTFSSPCRGNWVDEISSLTG